ncbi:MAG: hypothetical protein H0X43_04380 [Nitrosospira sp.]|nr:hypothetical protein [Nitrosospira sp.]
MKKRISEEQIIGFLKEADAGMPFFPLESSGSGLCRSENSPQFLPSGCPEQGGVLTEASFTDGTQKYHH